jgi:hypothetical protein
MQRKLFISRKIALMRFYASHLSRARTAIIETGPEDKIIIFEREF